MNSLEFSQYAILILTVMLFVAPIRYALFILLILSLFDASGPGFASASQIGILNGIKILLAPAIVIFRLKAWPIKILVHRVKNGAFLAFLSLLLYASAAALWSPWKLSAVKMMGYFMGHLLWFSVLLWGWRTGRLDLNLVRNAFLTAVGLGILQSYILEPSFGVYPFEIQRFTAFLSPQYYAAYITFTVIALVLGQSRERFLRAFVLLLVALTVVILTGSRYSFVSMGIVVLLFLLSSLTNYRTRIASFFVIWLLILGLFVVLLSDSFGYSISGPWLQRTRIAELRYLFSSPEEIGTLAWRLGMYNAVWENVARSKFTELLIGHGTSSAASVAIQAFPLQYSGETIDANRVVHDEFLRALYEWGIVGFALLAYIVLYIVVAAVRLSYIRKEYILFAALPLFISGLAIENVLASAGTAWGVGSALIFSMVYARSMDRNYYKEVWLGYGRI